MNDDRIIQPTEWQKRVLSVPGAVSIFLGGGRGRGATTCSVQMIIRACDLYPGSKHLFVRNQLRSLQEVEDSVQMLAVGALGPRAMRINRSLHCFTFPNGSTLEFAPLADNNDAAAIQGRSFDTVTADEVGGMNRKQIVWLDMLRSNLRGVTDCPKRMVWLANSGGTAHSALRSRFVAKLAPWVPAVLDDGVEWVYCPGTFKDNEHLPPTYQQNLFASAGRNKELYKSWAEGSWETASGALMADVLEPNQQMFDIKNLPYGVRFDDARSCWFISGDWGQTSPSVCYACVRLLSTMGPYPVGSTLLVKEVHSAFADDWATGQQWSPGFLAQQINFMIDSLHDMGMRNRFGVFDNARGLETDTLHKVFREYQLYTQSPHKKSILGGIAKFRELAYNSMHSTGRAGLWVSSHCNGFWETVPVMPRSTTDPERHDTNSVDHWYDAAAYAVTYEPQFTRIRANNGW